jgi:hypothetical protein
MCLQVLLLLSNRCLLVYCRHNVRFQTVAFRLRHLVFTPAEVVANATKAVACVINLQCIPDRSMSIAESGLAPVPIKMMLSALRWRGRRLHCAAAVSF